MENTPAESYSCPANVIFHSTVLVADGVIRTATTGAAALIWTFSPVTSEGDHAAIPQG